MQGCKMSNSHLLPLRSMVGQLPLEQHIGVRIPEGQPITNRHRLRRDFSRLSKERKASSSNCLKAPVIDSKPPPFALQRKAGKWRKQLLDRAANLCLAHIKVFACVEHCDQALLTIRMARLRCGMQSEGSYSRALLWRGDGFAPQEHHPWLTTTCATGSKHWKKRAN
jgi:hypothetical protein